MSIKLYIVLIFFICFAACANRIEPLITPNENESNTFNTTYSSDGKYFIEGYDIDVDYANTVIAPVVREIRIIEAGSGLTVWTMEGTSAPSFCWSPGNRYVSVSCGGRGWTSALVVDTTDMSQYQLPAFDEIAPMFPEAVPFHIIEPYFVPQQWQDEETIEVRFNWNLEDQSNLPNDMDINTFSGTYTFNVKTGEISVAPNKKQNCRTRGLLNIKMKNISTERFDSVSQGLFERKGEK